LNLYTLFILLHNLMDVWERGRGRIAVIRYHPHLGDDDDVNGYRIISKSSNGKFPLHQSIHRPYKYFHRCIRDLSLLDKCDSTDLTDLLMLLLFHYLTTGIDFMSCVQHQSHPTHTHTQDGLVFFSPLPANFVGRTFFKQVVISMAMTFQGSKSNFCLTLGSC